MIFASRGALPQAPGFGVLTVGQSGSTFGYANVPGTMAGFITHPSVIRLLAWTAANQIAILRATTNVGQIVVAGTTINLSSLTWDAGSGMYINPSPIPVSSPLPMTAGNVVRDIQIKQNTLTQSSLDPVIIGETFESQNGVYFDIAGNPVVSEVDAEDKFSSGDWDVPATDLGIDYGSYTQTIENQTFTTPITVQGSGYNNTRVRNCTFRDIEGDGLVIRGLTNFLLEDCIFENISGGSGIRVSQQVSSDGIRIINNTITNVGHDGIRAQREGNVVHNGLQIVGNTITRTGVDGLAAGGTGLLHGIYVQSGDALVEGNKIYDSLDGNGITLRSSGRVRRNYCHTTSKSGIAYYVDHPTGASRLLSIEGNIIVGSGGDGERTDIDILTFPPERGLSLLTYRLAGVPGA